MNRSVFQVVDTLRIGGAERMAVDVSNGLAARRWEVHLVATRELGPLEGDTHPDVHLTCLHRTGRFDLAGLRGFRRLVREHHPEIVHAHGWSSLQFCTAALVGLRRAPALVFHDHRGQGLAALPRSYRASAWPLTAAHIAVDRALLAQGPRTRLPAVKAVIANGIPLERFIPKHHYETASIPRLVMTANLRPEKDHPVLLAALAHLSESGIETSTDLLGALSDPDHEATCRHLIADLGLGDRVGLLGVRPDVGQLLASYDLGVLSSRTESGPIALIEYLACGLPFVVTDVGEVPAALPGELRRWVVPPGDPVALAEKLREALALTGTDRARIGALSRAHAQEHLSIDRTIDGVEAVYRQVVRTGGRGKP